MSKTIKVYNKAPMLARLIYLNIAISLFKASGKMIISAEAIVN